jgi:phage terminase large subunit
LSAWREAVESRWGGVPLVEEAMRAAAAPLRSRPMRGPKHADLARYQRDPVAWAVERLGITEPTIRWSMNPGYSKKDWTRPGEYRPTARWDGDVDPLVKIATALVRSESVAVESATGTGKTFWGAVLALWFLDVFRPTQPDGPGAIVITAAPKEQQLTLHIWKEIGALWSRFQLLNPAAELTQLRIRMRPGRADWGAVGFVAGVGAAEESSTKAQGFHAEHMLIILEEVPGIHPAVMAAFENTCTAPHNMRLGFGNPDNELDQLHLMAKSPGVTAVRISGYDHPNVVTGDPNVVPGAVSAGSLAIRHQKWGENHRFVLSRSRGISPPEATDALFRLSWLRDAVAWAQDPVEREELAREGRNAAGVDVANSDGGDRASIAEGRGSLLLGVSSHPCPDANAFAREHVARLIGPSLAAENVGIDGVGVGAGAVNEMSRLKLPVTSLIGSAKAIPDKDHEEEFVNLRSQMWWTAAREVKDGEVGILAEDEELFADLLAPRFRPVNGKIQVEEKESLKGRLPGRRSPDKGDAFVYWNWMRKPRRKVRDLSDYPVIHR